MKAYKGFNRDLTCNGFKYEQGKTYEIDKAELCECGFHACKQPLDVFQYYPPGTSIYHEVELDDVCDAQENNDSDSKVCAKKITIGAKLSIDDLVKAQVQYVRDHCKPQSDDTYAATAGVCGAATAGESGAATAGNYGAATAGVCGAATAGNHGAATAGESGAATAGNYGAATAGVCGAATAGESGAATAGNYGAATAGNYGAATSRGRSAVGINGVAVARGINVCAKGGIGALLVLVAEDEYTNSLIAWKAAIVDGKNIKPNTWYKLNDGEFVEAEEQ